MTATELNDFNIRLKFMTIEECKEEYERLCNINPLNAEDVKRNIVARVELVSVIYNPKLNKQV